MRKCNSESCRISFDVMGYVLQTDALFKFVENAENDETYFSLTCEVNGQVFVQSASFAVNSNLHFKIPVNNFDVSLNDTQAPVAITVIHTKSNQIYLQQQTTVLIVQASDIGITPRNIASILQSDQRNAKKAFDFIEIGTSNFDTSSQRTQSLLANGTVQNAHGLSVDALEQYISSLPVVEGVTKLCVAITNDPDQDVMHAYYIPESVIDAVRNC